MDNTLYIKLRSRVLETWHICELTADYKKRKHILAYSCFNGVYYPYGREWLCMSDETWKALTCEFDIELLTREDLFMELMRTNNE